MYVINHVFKITFLLWGLSNCSRWSTHWWVEGGLGPKIWDLNRPSSNRSNCGLTRRFVWDGQQTVRFQPRQFLDYDKTETDRSWDTHISRLARRVDRIFGVIFTPMYRCSWQDLIRLAGKWLGAWKKPGGSRHAWCPQKFGHVNDWVVSCSGCSSQPRSAGRARLLGGRGWIGGIRIMELMRNH